MTMIAALIGKDGIVAITDGRAVDERGTLLRDDVAKIYKFSELCAVMVTGEVGGQIESALPLHIKHYRESGVRYASHVAYNLSDELKKGRRSASSIGLMIAGYELSEHDEWLLQIFYIDSGHNWNVYNKKPCRKAGSGK